MFFLVDYLQYGILAPFSSRKAVLIELAGIGDGER
jgi:hypothetical protein